jgi:hypothetical protein
LCYVYTKNASHMLACSVIRSVAAAESRSTASVSQCREKWQATCLLAVGNDKSSITVLCAPDAAGTEVVPRSDKR